VLGVAAWLPVMLGMAEEAVRAPRAGHIFGNMHFLPLAMDLLGLNVFYSRILTISTVKLSPFSPRK